MNIPEPGRLVDFIAANTDLEVAERQELLATLDVQERLRKITRLLTHDLEVLEVGSRIQNQIKESMGKGQREYYLREQLKAIQQELGETDSNQAELDDLKAKLDAVGLSEEARKEADRELRRLARIPGASPEYGIVRGYLEWLSELPWSASTEDDLNLRRAERVLNEDHHDLEKVKDRILDYLAVRNLKGDSRGPILCFAGPPGVGKTSLGQSIARALGRKFIRLALGGVRDESEIRGHRRTYIGALPGRIIQSLRRGGSNNPVIMLDEVDKLSAGFQGDPSAALLEVLDPAQNSTFTDNYLMVPFDLSKVLFIATANQLDPIPPALRDRMEVISLPGYTEDDKLQIARKFLVQRQIAENGLQPGQLRLSDDTLRAIIRGYTRESGVRNLEREIGTVARKAARLIASGKGKRLVVSPQRLDDFLGPIRFRSTLAEGADEVGVATGLAWTPVGGEILFIEVLAVPGGGNLILTGQLGDVMKESARAALTYARSRAAALGIDLKKADKLDLHVHIPAGHPEGRPLGGDRDGHGADLGVDQAPDQPHRWHDRRGHLTRQGPANRRLEGESAGCPPGWPAAGALPGRESIRSRRDPTARPTRPETRTGRAHGPGARASAAARSPPGADQDQASRRRRRRGTAVGHPTREARLLTAEFGDRQILRSLYRWTVPPGARAVASADGEAPETISWRLTRYAQVDRSFDFVPAARDRVTSHRQRGRLDHTPRTDSSQQVGISGAEFIPRISD